MVAIVLSNEVETSHVQNFSLLNCVELFNRGSSIDVKRSLTNFWRYGLGSKIC